MSKVMSAIYGGGPFYSGGSAVINDLKSSGFSTVVAWALHINSSGDFIFNDTPILTNGSYVGDPNWPTLFNTLKSGNTSVNRVLFSVGGWGAGDFPNIKNLIFPTPASYPNQPNIGPNSVLYKNFSALKSVITVMDGVDFDDETLYDQPTTVAFATLLNSLGLQVTFCPYVDTNFWVSCLQSLNTPSNPNVVTGFNLQCYAGGGGNNPQDWIDAISTAMGPSFPSNSFVFPGLWCINGSSCSSGQCPTGAESIGDQMAAWSKSSQIQGGFIWLYDDILHCENSGVCPGSMTSADYAASINDNIS